MGVQLKRWLGILRAVGAAIVVSVAPGSGALANADAAVVA